LRSSNTSSMKYLLLPEKQTVKPDSDFRLASSNSFC
jgi:hypothetical protein